MPLEKQIVVIPAGKLGIDTGSEPRGAQGLLRVENAEWALNAVVGKRIGSTRYAGTTGGEYLAEYRGGCARFGSWKEVTDVASGLSYGGAAGSGYNTAPIGLLDSSVQSIAQRSREAYYYCTSCSSPTVIAVAYIARAVGTPTTYSTWIETYDLATGIPITQFNPRSGTPLPEFCRIVLIGTELHYYYLSGYSNKLFHGTIAPEGAISGPTDITPASHAPLGTVVEWDACAIQASASTGNVAYVMIAYAGNATGRLNLLACPAGINPVALDIEVGAGAHAISKPAIWPQSSTAIALACVVDNTTWRLNVGIYTYALVPLRAMVEVETAVKAAWTPHSVTGAAESWTTGRVFWSLTDSSAVPVIRRAPYSTDGAGAAELWLSRARLATKAAPGQYATNLIILGVYSRSWNYVNGTQDVVIVVDHNGQPVASIRPGLARCGDSYGLLPDMQSIGAVADTQWLTVIMHIVALDNSADNRDVYQVNVVIITDLAQVDAVNVMGGTRAALAVGYARMLIPSALPFEVAGTLPVEHGFLSYPEPFSLVGTNSGGAMGDGTYRYRLCYEWTDSNGVRHASAPSPEYGSVTLSAGGGAAKVTITCPTLTLTRRSTGVQIAVYRTVADIGTDYYRVGTVANDATAQTVTFVDTQPDAFIVDMDSLYTDSGELENTPPKPHRISALWQSRHFIVDREAEVTDICYSKEYGPKTPVNHNDALVVRCSSDGGPIRALVAFVDKLIVFKDSQIYAIEGTGYDATLGGSNYQTPWLVNPALGCSDPRCIALTPMGLVFLGGDRHIYVLDHSMSCNEISDPVHYWIDTLAPVAFVAEPARRLLHVLTATYDLVYDWSQRRWMTWSGREAREAVSAGGVLHWMDPSFYVHKNDATLWTDNGVRYATIIESTWLSAGSLGGMQRIYRLLIVGYNIAAHGLRVKIAYDGDPTWVDSALYPSALLSTFNVDAHFGDGLGESYQGQAYCVEVFPTRPCCSSIRVQIGDESGTGNTWSLAALVFLVGVKPGKLQRVQRERVL